MSFKSTFLYVLAFGVIYIIWSIIYQFIADEAVYPVLDWKEDPLTAFIVSVAVAISSLLIHLFLCWSNGKLLSKIGYQHGDNAPFITLSESIHDHTEISKDQTIHDAGANASLASYGTQPPKNSIVVATNQ